MSKDLIKFKSEFENGKSFANFNIVTLNEKTNKPEIQLIKIPVYLLNNFSL
jgi:hypothetical protein